MDGTRDPDQGGNQATHVDHRAGGFTVSLPVDWRRDQQFPPSGAGNTPAIRSVHLRSAVIQAVQTLTRQLGSESRHFACRGIGRQVAFRMPTKTARRVFRRALFVASCCIKRWLHGVLQQGQRIGPPPIALTPPAIPRISVAHNASAPVLLSRSLCNVSMMPNDGWCRTHCVGSGISQ